MGRRKGNQDTGKLVKHFQDGKKKEQALKSGRENLWARVIK